MATLTERYALAQRDSFQRRVAAAAVSAALDVAAEAKDTAGHAARAAFAVAVLDDPYSAALVLALGVAQNVQIAAAELAVPDSAPDNDLLFQMAAIWDAYAGV